MIERLPRLRLRHVALAALVVALAALTWAPRTAPSATPVPDGEGAALAAQTEEVATEAEVPVGEAPAVVEVEAARPAPTSREMPTGVVEPAEAPADPAAMVDLEPVTVSLPRVRIDRAPRDLVTRVSEVEGVRRATEVRLSTMELDTPSGTQDVSVASVVPREFRALTPQLTADAVEVWERVLEGAGAFTHETGQRLELELGELVPVTGGGELRVGAYASNGAPPLADVVMSRDRARSLGVSGDRTVLVATDGDPAEVAERLRRAFDVEVDVDLDVEVIETPKQRRAFLTGADAEDAFEPFTYVSYGDGMIEIDADWVRRHIVRAEVPILRGEVVCHRLMIPQLRGALQEIEDRGLADLIDPSQYGGCWVPRHILFNPRRALSMHAWGVAVDLNVRGNEYGRRDFEMDPRIVEVFDRWGFNWGGRWSTPDAMHFELGAVLDSPEG